MICEQCKGTGRITLLFSQVDCDCVVEKQRRPGLVDDRGQSDRMAEITSSLRGMRAGVAWRDSCPDRAFIQHAAKVMGRAGNLTGARTGACYGGPDGSGGVTADLWVEASGHAIRTKISAVAFREAREDLAVSSAISMVRKMMEAGHVR